MYSTLPYFLFLFLFNSTKHDKAVAEISWCLYCHVIERNFLNPMPYRYPTGQKMDLCISKQFPVCHITHQLLYCKKYIVVLDTGSNPYVMPLVYVCIITEMYVVSDLYTYLLFLTYGNKALIFI